MTNKNIKTSQKNTPGALYVVATPIGNLEDISVRAVQILSTVDLIACEDTRHTRKLCHYCKIETPLFSYYREREQERSEILINLLAAGKDIALVSDAGTPAICDPGSILVNKARGSGIKVVPIAGPSALTASLSIAGLTDSQFFFGGFLPARSTDRKKFLKNVSSLPYPLIFYETPHRIYDSLLDMADILGKRRIQLFRELSKIHEEHLDGIITDLAERVREGVKGELVLVVQGAMPTASEKPESIEELILWHRDELQTSLKDTVRNIASDLDIPRSSVYKRALAVWKKSD